MSGARIGAALALLAALGYAGYWITKAPAQSPPAAPPAIPVEIATATQADVPVYLDGLGAVQAFNTVTVTTRVDGQLQKVAFVEGQDVKPGDVLARIDPRPYRAQLDQTLAKKAQDEAQLANAKRDLERYIALAPEEYTSRQTLDTARAQVAQLEAQIKGDQAAIDAARTQLAYTTITAPLGGRTGIRLVDQGNIVHATDTSGIVVITQLQPISVVFTLPAGDLPQVAQAMAAGAVAVTALSRDGKSALDQGTVALIDNKIDPTTGTMRLKATFPNQGNSLWPGQFVNVRLLLRTARDAVTVPSAAIARGPNGLFTYVVKPDATVEMRAVKVSQDSGGVAVIDSGLQADERVVTAGQYRLQPGAQVRIQTARAP